MLLATVETATGHRCAAVAADHGSGWTLLDTPDAGAVLADPRRAALLDTADRPTVDAADLRFHTPVPQPRKVICCGLNYRDHILETGRGLPAFPTLFTKFADMLIGPTDDIVVIGSDRIDWEAELTVVIGQTVRAADPDTARAAIFGWTVANDISLRDWQNRTLQWWQGKAHDATTPVGPVIVTADALDPSDGLRIACHVDDELVQSDDTRQLVFDPAELVAYVSSITVLRPGDLILTGTPGGVGMGRTPPRYLADGSVVRTTIDGIGELRNTVRTAPGLRTESTVAQHIHPEGPS